MTDLLANQEIAFNMGYAPGEASLRISDGVYPETIRTFLMDTGTLSNNNYVAIPFNAANPAGAMVVANYIISPEFQLVMADPERWGWEIPTDPSTWPAEAQSDPRFLPAWGGHPPRSRTGFEGVARTERGLGDRLGRGLD